MNEFCEKCGHLANHIEGDYVCRTNQMSSDEQVQGDGVVAWPLNIEEIPPEIPQEALNEALDNTTTDNGDLQFTGVNNQGHLTAYDHIANQNMDNGHNPVFNIGVEEVSHDYSGSGTRLEMACRILSAMVRSNARVLSPTEMDQLCVKSVRLAKALIKANSTME